MARREELATGVAFVRRKTVVGYFGGAVTVVRAVVALALVVTALPQVPSTASAQSITLVGNTAETSAGTEKIADELPTKLIAGSFTTIEGPSEGPIAPNSPPEFAAAAASWTVAENTAAGDASVAVTASDPDGDALTYSAQALTYSVVGGADDLAAFNEDFELNATSGQISIKSGGSIDFEDRESYIVVIAVTDSKDSAGAVDPAIDDTLTLTINVSDAEEPGTVTVSGTTRIGFTLSADVTDPDGDVTSVVWVWSRASSMSGPFNTISGQSNSSYTLTPSDEDMYVRASATYSDRRGPAKTANTTTGPIAANSPPEFDETSASRTVAENTASGNIGAAVTASDADGDTLTYSVTQTASGGADDLAAFNEDFELNATTGQISINSVGSIDFEDRERYIVVIAVTDSKGPGDAVDPAIDDTVTLTINVIDAEEPGTVTVSGTTRVGRTLSAELADLDGGVTSVVWVWSRASSMSGPFNTISGQSNSSYTLTTDDEDMYMRASATYSDRRGPAKTANTTKGPIQANASAANSPPEFAAASVSWTVAENTAAGDASVAVTASDADGDALTYSAQALTYSVVGGADDLAAFNEDFELNATSGQISIKAGGSIDFEDRESYIVVIAVTDSKDSAGAVDPAIDDTLTLTINVSDAEEPGTVTVSGTTRVGFTLSAELADPDGDVTSVVWVWSRASSMSGPFNTISGQSNSSYTLTPSDEDMYVRASATYSDRRGPAKTANTTKGPIKDASALNSPPEFAETSVSWTVAENTAAGDVGEAVAASDADNDTLTYSVAQAASGGADDLAAFNEDFELNATSGQISIKAGGSIDFEDRESYIVVIAVTDSKDPGDAVDPAIDDTVTLTINVIDAEEPGTVTVSGTTRVGRTLFAEVADLDGGVTSVVWVWSRASSMSGPFNTISGQSNSSYTLTPSDEDMYVRASATYSDRRGPAKTANTTKGPITANSPAEFDAATSWTVAENTASGDVVAAVTASDADGDTLTYSVAQAASGGADDLAAFNEDFELNPTSGQISVKAGALIDFEDRESYIVVIAVTDSKDPGDADDPAIDDTVTLTINVIDAEEPGTVTVSGTTRVGRTLSAEVADPDGGVTSVVWVWSRASSLSGSFNTISGQSNSSYTLTTSDEDMYVRASATYSDRRGPAKTANTTKGPIQDASASNSPPEFDGAVSRTVAENTAAGDVGAAVTASDADNDILTYSVAQAASTEVGGADDLAAFNEDFELNSTSGQISIKPGGSIDFEDRQRYIVVIAVTDSKDPGDAVDPAIDDTATLTINVSDAEEPGTVTVSGTTRVGRTLSAELADPDGGVTSVVWVWSRASSMSGPFNTISGQSNSSYTLTTSDEDMYVRATATYSDRRGPAKTANTTTGPIAANSPPEFDETSTSRTVAENTAAGDVGAAVTASDADNDILTYSVAQAASGGADDLAAFNEDFELNSTSGQISIKAGGSIDFEDRERYIVVIAVTDSVDPAIDDTVTLTINVSDAEEPGTVTVSGTTRVGRTLSAELADPDGDVTSVVWVWSRASSMSGPFSAISGQSNSSYTLTTSDEDMYVRATATYSDRRGDAKTANTTKGPITANSPAEFADTSVSRTVAENTASGDVGEAVAASDADNDTLTYSVAQAASGGADDLAAFNEDFELNATSGQISIKSGASIDFEDRESYIVVIAVTDSKNSGDAVDPAIDDTATLTINVSDAEEPGTVTVSGTTRVGRTLSAGVADPDGGVTSVVWVWSRALSMSGPFSAISGQSNSSYTLISSDEDMYVRASATYSDRRGPAKTANTTTGPITANSPPEFDEASVSRTVAENTAAGDVGEAVAASDADGDTLTYSVAQAASGGADDLVAFNEDFELNPTSGQISINSGASIDFEDRESYIVVIAVTDSKDSGDAVDPAIDDTVTLTINVSDAEEPGTVTVSGTTRVGRTLSAELADPDGDVTSVVWVWSRASSMSGPFSAISGQSNSSYTLTTSDEDMYVRASATYSDRRGDAKTANTTKGPIAANSPAEFADTSVSRTVAENTASGDVGEAVAASDADGDTLTYSVAQAASGGADDLVAFNEDFELNATSGQISIKSVGSIDFEDRESYIVVIAVTDSKDPGDAVDPAIDDTATLTINVSDAEEPGTVTVSGTTRVGRTLSAEVADPDGGVTSVVWVWSRASSMSGPFNTISGQSNSNYTLTTSDEDMYVRASATYSDRRGDAKTANTTTGPITANSPAKFDEASVSRTVAENTASGDVVAAVTARDADGDTLTYSVAQAASGGADDLVAFNEDFELNVTTGQISINSGASIDFEDRQSYIVVIAVTDKKDPADAVDPTIDDTVTLTINVIDAEEPGTVTVSGTTRVGRTLSADVADPDGDVTSVVWVWSRASSTSGPFNTISGQSNSNYTLTTSDEDMYVRATATYSDRRGDAKTANTTTGPIQANSPPEFTETSNSPPEFAETSTSWTVAENTAAVAAVTASDADGDTLTYSVAQAASGGADDLAAFNEDFELNPTSGQISIKAGGSIDFEDRESYIVVIAVTDSKNSADAVDPAIDDTVTLTINVSDAEEPGTVTVSGTTRVGRTLSAEVADPDGGVTSVVWVWSRASSLSGSFSAISGQSNSSYTLTSSDEDMYVRASATYSDRRGPAKTANTTKGPITANSPAKFDAASVSRPVAENTASGNIGAAVSASDADGDTLTYSVAQAASGGADDLAAFNEDFELNPTSGQISVKAGALIDFEDRESYIVVIAVTDKKDPGDADDPAIDDTVTLTINVIDAEEPGTVTVSGTTRVGFTLSAEVADPDGGVTSVVWVWSRASSMSGPFNTISGQSNSSYTLTPSDEDMYVRASATYSDRRGPAKTANTTKGPIQAASASNSPAEFSAASVSRTVAENTAGGDVGAAVTASDADNDTLIYSVAQAASGGADDLVAFNEDFELNSTSGQISIKAGGSIDFEDRERYIVVIAVTDSKDPADAVDPAIDDTATLTINVSDAEEPGTVTVSGTTRVGRTLSAEVADPDGGVTSVVWVWSRASSMSGPFNTISGQSNSSYTLTTSDEDMYVRATATYSDRRGPAKTANTTKGPITANSPAEFTAASASRTVAENTAAGDVGAAVTASDADNDTLTYSVTQAASGGADDLAAFNEDFELNATTGQISIKAGASIDFEDRERYIVVIAVTDSKDPADADDPAIDDTVTLTINVSDAEEPGTVKVSGTTRVGRTLSAELADPDGGVTSVVWVWSRASSLSGSFSAISGQSNSSYTLTTSDEDMYVRASATYSDRRGDAKTANTTKGPIQTASASNSPPEFDSASASRTVAENTAAGDVGAAVTASDADNDTLIYSVAQAASGGADDLVAFNEDFELNPTSGQISIKAGGSIDFEDRERYIVVIAVTDSKDPADAVDPAIDDTATLTINVSDAEEPGTVTVSGTTRVGPTLSAELADPDGGVTSVVWVWSRASSMSGPFNTISGQSNSSYTLTTSDEDMYVRASATYSDRRGPAKTANTTKGPIQAASATNSPPEFTAEAVWRTVAENTAAGDIGAAVAASDADGDTLTYSVAQAASGGADDLAAFNEDFELNATSGQVSVKAGALIDFEDRESYIVVIAITDSKDPADADDPAIDDTLTLTINVIDAEEPGTGGGDGGAKESSEALTAAQRFNDVDEDDWFAHAVGWMLKNEITTGCEPDRFCPHRIATRAHFVTFLWRAAGRPEPAVTGTERFDDVDESAYYQQAVGWAAAEGITTGCGDGTIFCPDQHATRGQLAAFLYRYSGHHHTVTEATFQDVSTDAYYFSAVEWMAANAITSGCAADRFCPDTSETRAQVAELLHRYFTQQPQPRGL